MQDQNTVSHTAGWYPDTANPGTLAVIRERVKALIEAAEPMAL